jgi:exopolysaccharide production protein ExoZ
MRALKPSGKVYSLQALRAIAAWLVIAAHALHDVTHGELSNPMTSFAWALGSIGVDIFFVISGFIMVHICWDDFALPGGAQHFMRRRIVRIVPLYWVATIAALVFHRVSAKAPEGWAELLQSLLFIPYYKENVGWRPILGQGWTLNYEMMFYAIFAVALTFPRKLALPGIAVVLGIVTSVGPVLPSGILTYLSSPIVLWFVLGVAIATLWQLGGFVEPKGLARSVKFLEPFGDASYSSYLVHGFALTMLLRVWEAPSAWFVPAGLVVATGAGLGVHIMIEKPMLQAMTRRKPLIIYRAPRQLFGRAWALPRVGTLRSMFGMAKKSTLKNPDFRLD